MKAHYRAFGGRLVVEIEFQSIKDLFAQVGPVAEVLDGDTACGKCSSPLIYPRVRDAKKSDGKVVQYYELVCSTCGAKLSYGQHSEGGTLWAKRADDNGLLEHRGWHLYQGLPAPAAAPAPQQQRRAAPTAPASRQTVEAFPEDTAELKTLLAKPDRVGVEIEISQRLIKIVGQDRANGIWADCDHPDADTFLRRIYLRLKSEAAAAGA